jgi:flagellar hook assembly protein FlgD
VDTITIGEGEGDGQTRLDIDTGDEPTTLIVHQSGGSNEPGLPAIRWKGTNDANSIVIHDGEFGAAVYATEQATIDTLVQHAGLVQMGTVTMGSLTKHGGELIAENATLAGALKLHA